MNPWISLVFLSSVGGLVSAQGTQPASVPEGLPKGYELLYSSDAAKRLRSDLVFSDPAAWDVADGELSLVRQSRYKPPVRSPWNFALIQSLAVDDFVLEAELQSTGREYGHLDMCLFFGVQARDKFYYAHIAQAADDHAHNLFRVDGKPRIKFASRTTKGIRWGKGRWHKVRIVRDVTSGSVAVFFDDMQTPIMTGEDRTFGSGQIGFGSFDDTGRIRKIRIWGRKGSKPSDLGFASDTNEVRIRQQKDLCHVELGGQLFAEYRWGGKPGPCLWPVSGPMGIPMTRAWPVGTIKAIESKDHPHHRSLWFAHGDVNGHDFWSGQDGSHVVQRSIRIVDGNRSGDTLLAKDDWLDAEGEVVCRDERRWTFSGDGSHRVLDLDIRLHASEGPLHFGETKEGTMALRMQPRLRLRGKHAEGQVQNSEGVRGVEVWGKRARWVAYWAPLLPKDDKKPQKSRDMGLVLFDHPDNPGYPCHWHARDYGLLAANPFGSKSFGGTISEGFDLEKGKTLRLRYRFVFFMGPADRKQLDLWARTFSRAR